MTEHLTAYKSQKAFETAIRGTVKAEGNLREKYQSYGLHALAHFADCGDASRCASLINLMSTQSPYRKLMFKWLKEAAPLAVSKLPEDKVKFSLRKRKKDEENKPQFTDTNLPWAEENKFWMMLGMPGVLTLDPYDLIEKMLTRYDDAPDNEKVGRIVKLDDTHRSFLMRIIGEHKVVTPEYVGEEEKGFELPST